MSRRSGKIKPIFMDSSGNRRRLFTAVAAAAGALLTSAVVILVAGFFGAGPSHLPGLPDLLPAQQEVAKVPETPTLPRSPGGGAPNTGTPRAGNPALVPSSTSDTRGNGNRPTHTPNHPQPTKTK